MLPNICLDENITTRELKEENINKQRHKLIMIGVNFDGGDQTERSH